MQTPCDKRINYNQSFSNNRFNFFTASGQCPDLFFLRENNMFSPYDFSLNKYFVNSYKRPYDKFDSTIRKNKLKFSNIKVDKENSNCKSNANTNSDLKNNSNNKNYNKKQITICNTTTNSKTETKAYSNKAEVHKLSVKKSSFKISNVNFDIKLSYMK